MLPIYKYFFAELKSPLVQQKIENKKFSRLRRLKSTGKRQAIIEQQTKSE